MHQFQKVLYGKCRKCGTVMSTRKESAIEIHNMRSVTVSNNLNLWALKIDTFSNNRSSLRWKVSQNASYNSKTAVLVRVITKRAYSLTLDTFGNCQRPIFSLGVSQHNFMHSITNLWKCGLNWSPNLQENNERKRALFVLLGVISDA